MTDSIPELEDLEREVRRLIEENKKFLSRVLDDDFEPEEEEEADEPEVDG
jgi:hypothetical protein